ncbi:hypothetical protein JCM10908_002113 [Rhodotorula pacifica]|uniref:uncharacterized protein n=1 Tax=Rhodotorula pacifica TaxID=1495444 RepID=UPI0031741378
MSPPTSSTGKRGSSRPAASTGASKKSGSRSGNTGGGGGAGTGHKRSASSAAIEEEYYTAASKRTKRNASAKKSLREEELGVGAELAEDDMIEAGDDANLDEDGDEGDGGVTRCVCGEDNEEMASGLMIQCDTCKCWQHGPCVGLWDEKECPNRYFCELCKPNLHGPGGLLRKVTRKTSAAPAGRAVTPPAAPATQSTSHKGHRPRESADASMIAAYLSADGGHSPEQKPSSGLPAAAAAGPHKEPKKRSTMNSRDAAYDDAIALSILEAGTAAMRAKLEKTHESEGEQSDVEEIVISGAGGRGKGKKTSGSKGGAKGGRGSNASARGGKGKSTRGRREQSNLDEEGEDESPAPAQTAEEAMKQEAFDAADPALAESGDGGMTAKAGGEDRLRNGDASESASQSARRETAAEGGPSNDRSPSPEAPAQPQPPPPTGTRTKHPNQYTYRGKNGQASSTRGGKSPSKRAGAASSTLGSTANGHEAAAPKPLSSAAAQAVAGWGMPDHLRHLAHLLPAPAPTPLSIISLVDPSEPPTIEPPTKVRFPGKRVTMPEMRKRARAVLEFVTKVQLEMSERDRRWELLRDVNEQVKEAREKDAREKANRANGAGSGSGSGSGSRSTGDSDRSRASSLNPRGVGGTTPVPVPSTSTDPSQYQDFLPARDLPPIPNSDSTAKDPLALSSSASPACVELMDALTKEVMLFQQKFFGQAD